MEKELLLDRAINRREFINRAGIMAGGLAFLVGGCATFDPATTKDPKDFDIKAFDRWYRRNKLYRVRNPNLRRPHYANHIFTDTFHNTWTPGLDYSVPPGEIMVAAASGDVVRIQELRTGRAGGLIIDVVYPSGETRLYTAFYAHLADPVVKIGQKVNRGDSIAYVPLMYSDIAKLMLTEGRGGALGNWVDPDNYGLNHDYMNYSDGTTNLEGRNQEQMLQKQLDLYYKFRESSYGERHETAIRDLDLRFHKGGFDSLCLWSTVEKFRYLEALYEVHPESFPKLVKEEFKGMRKEFHENQPITLTLPFKKR